MSWRTWRRSDVSEMLLLIGCLSALVPPIGCQAAHTLAMTILRGRLRSRRIGKRWYCSTPLWTLRIKSRFLKRASSILWIWCIYLGFHGHGLVFLGFYTHLNETSIWGMLAFIALYFWVFIPIWMKPRSELCLSSICIDRYQDRSMLTWYILGGFFSFQGSKDSKIWGFSRCGIMIDF